MNNPWLDIPEVDYIGHMSSPAVGQRPVLARLLRDVLESVRPAVVLVLGGSTGNGLEHVDPAVTSRVVVVDINSRYLRSLRERLPNPSFALDVRCGDLADVELGSDVYDLVHAGLILEYVAWPLLLPRVASALRLGGVFNVVVQTPSASSQAVTQTMFTSLQVLVPLFRFVDPTALVDAARGQGLCLQARRSETLPAGKSFEVLRFVKGAV